jgi:Spy/CpxP family protein refolding chaperone
MARLTACCLAVLVFLVMPDRAAAHDRGQQKPGQPAQAERPAEGQRDRWKWWLYDRTELSITDKQSADIDMIFETTLPAQRARREELERLESALAILVKENKADVSAVAQQVDKIENIRAELNKTRTVMLYQINRLLTAEQRVKLEKLRARRDAERGKNPDHRR